MSVAPIDAISMGHIDIPEIGANEAIQGGPSFSQALGSEVGELNSSLIDADASVRSLVAGENVSTQDVMMAMEHAHLKLQFAIEVRNRVVDAYQNLTSMQL